MSDIDQSTKDYLVRQGLALCRAAGDHEQLLQTARSFRYWSLRLELIDQGPVEEELTLIAEPDVAALRCVMRQDRRMLRQPVGDWQLKGAMLLTSIVRTPALSDVTAQGKVLLAAEPSAARPPRKLADRWSVQRGITDIRSRQLDGHSRPVTGAVMLGGRPWLATVDDSEVLIWDMEREILRAILSGGDGSEVMAACAPADGKWLATVQVPGGQIGQTVGNPASLRVWDLHDGKQPRTLADEARNAYDCEVSPDGKWLVGHCFGRAALFWDTTDWKLAGKITGLADDIRSNDSAATCYAPDGSWFALASVDGTIGLWNPTTGEPLHLLAGGKGQATSLRAPWDSSWLASLNQSGIRIWDTRRGTLLRTEPMPVGGIGGLVADPQGRWVAASFGPDSVRVIPVRAGGRPHAYGHAAVRWISRRLTSPVTAGSWEFVGARCHTTRKGDRIVSVTASESTAFGGNQILTSYDFSSWSADGARRAGPAGQPGGLPLLAVHTDGQWAATVSDRSEDESRVVFFDPATAAVTGAVSYGRDRVRSVASDSRTVAVGFESGAVRLFQPGSATPVAQTPDNRLRTGLMGCHAPSHGGWVLVWADRKVHLLDPRSGAIRIRLAGQETGQFVNSLSDLCGFAPDGSWIATMDDDWTLTVWDPRNGQQQARIPVEPGERFFPGSCASADWMVTIADGRRLRVRNNRAFLVGELPGHGTDEIFHATLIGFSVLIAQDQSGLHAWDLHSGRRLYDLPGEHGAAALGPAPQRPDGVLVTLGQQGGIRFRDPGSSQVRATFDADFADARREGDRIGAMHPAGNWVAVTGDRAALAVCVTSTGEVRQLSGRSDDQVTACAASPDGLMLATTRRSGVLTVWNTISWEQLAVANTEGALTGVCWSPDNGRIYAVGDFGAACFDVTTGS